MKHLLKLTYIRACRRYGPGGLTLSAWLWRREIQGRGRWARVRVDRWFARRGDFDHCRKQYERETA